MSVLDRLFPRRPAGAKPASGAPAQAVLVHLDAQGLPEHVYRDHDLSTLEDQLERAIRDGALGELDGHEAGPGDTTIYLYGPDAESLFAGIEPVLRRHPLCQGARVVVRRGAPGAVQREVRV